MSYYLIENKAIEGIFIKYKTIHVVPLNCFYYVPLRRKYGIIIEAK